MAPKDGAAKSQSRMIRRKLDSLLQSPILSLVSGLFVVDECFVSKRFVLFGASWCAIFIYARFSHFWKSNRFTVAVKMATKTGNMILINIFWICLGITCCSAMDCTHDILGVRTTFSCPKFNDDRDERYCCGPPGNQDCCDDDDFLVNLGLSTGGIAAIIISVIVVVGIVTLICCCCCSCCLLAKRRERRGVVLSPPPQATTVVTSQMTYPAYPNQGQYSVIPQGYPQQGAQMPPQPYPPYPVSTGYPGQQLPQEYSKPPPYSQ